MSNKPSIYAFCQAGCKWETLHKDDFLNGMAYIDLSNSGQHDEIALEKKVTYRIHKTAESGGDTWGFNIYFDTGDAIEQHRTNVTLPEVDNYKGYLTFCLLGFEVKAVSEDTVDITAVYELNGERLTSLIFNNIGANFSPIETYLESYEQLERLNDGKVVIQPQKLFIRYADDDKGTNMSATYTGQKYIGQFVGVEVSNDPSAYTWALFGADESVNKEYIDNEINELKAMLYGSVWKESTATYQQLNTATIDKTDDSLPIVSNQYGALKELKAFSYVENQLVDYQSNWFVDKSGKGVDFVVNKANGTINVSGTATETGGISFNEIAQQINHIYIIYSDKLSVNFTGAKVEENATAKIVRATANQNGYPSVWLTQGQTYNVENATFKVVDLTLMFGAGNEPTTIAEWEALGIEIPSEYVEPHIVSSRPTKLTAYGYNLFDEELQLKTINPATGVESESDRGLSSVNFIKVYAGQSLTLNDGNISGYSYKYLCFYDNNKNFVSSINQSSTNPMTTTIPNNVSYVKIYYLKPSGQSWTIPVNPQIYLHNASVNLGYQPYIEPSTINLTLPETFISAGNAKDKLKVVAKDNGLYDLVHESNVGSVWLGDSKWEWRIDSYNRIQFTSASPKIPNAKGGLNMLCTKGYTPTTNFDKDPDLSMQLDANGLFAFKDSSITETIQIPTHFANTYLYYEKAQPTETTIATNITEEQLKLILQRGGSIVADEVGCDVSLDVVGLGIAE